jgi:hypothetical protein
MSPNFSWNKRHLYIFVVVTNISLLLLLWYSSVFTTLGVLPFPLQKLQKPESDWLIATMSPAHGQQRRNIIRATWQTLFPQHGVTTRFVISDPGELWMPLIQHENATYGDIIMLPGLEESHHVANTIKSIEFLKYLVDSGSLWKFVSKVDDDSFVNMGTFYRTYMIPRLGNDSFNNQVAIARGYTHPFPVYDYPQGGFYTFSWGLVRTLTRLYEENPIKDEHEDVLNGRLLYEAGEDFEFEILDHRLAFDYDESNEDVWAWAHRVTKEAIYVHNLKEDETYLKVASMFDSKGPKSDVPG